MKKKVKEIIVSLFLLVFCMTGCLNPSEEVNVEKFDYETIYNKFLKQEIMEERGFAWLHETSFQLELDQNNSILAIDEITDVNLGVIGGDIVDLDKDEIPELILSYVDNSDEKIGQLVIEIYTVRDGQVVKVDSNSGELSYEFFYNKCQGNVHVFLQEVNGKPVLSVLKALERSFGALYYDVMFDIYCMEDGKISCKASAAMLTDEEYKGQAGRIQEKFKAIVELGNWFVDEFEIGLGESGTGVFAPYDFNLSELDNSLKEIVRIRATRENGIQSFQYYDFSELRESIGLNKAYRDLLEQEIIPKIGIASNGFDPHEELSYDDVFGNVDEKKLGLVSALEYDCDGDNVLELLVFYLKQEMQTVEETGLLVQKLYIDLYSQKDNKAVFVGTVDALEPVMPWSSVFAVEDSFNAWIKTFENNTYLYISRGSTNEGPVQTAFYIYNLTDLNSIQKCIYYMPIIDAGRLNGELMIPATINGGSSGEHEFVAKVINGEIELYYEAFEGSIDESFEELKFKSFLEAEKQIGSELLAMGFNLAEPEEELTKVLAWSYIHDGNAWIQIDDYTRFQSYLNVLETDECIQIISEKTESEQKAVSDEQESDVEQSAQLQETLLKEEKTEMQENCLIESVCGVWTIDVDKFNEMNSDNFRFAYGSGIEYGHKMEFTENGSFSYFIGISADGKGSYSQEGDQVSVNIISSENGGELGQQTLSITKENGKTYIVMEDYEYQVYWYKQ